MFVNCGASCQDLHWLSGHEQFTRGWGFTKNLTRENSQDPEKDRERKKERGKERERERERQFF